MNLKSTINFIKTAINYRVVQNIFTLSETMFKCVFKVTISWVTNNLTINNTNLFFDLVCSFIFIKGLPTVYRKSFPKAFAHWFLVMLFFHNPVRLQIIIFCMTWSLPKMFPLNSLFSLNLFQQALEK